MTLERIINGILNRLGLHLSPLTAIDATTSYMIDPARTRPLRTKLADVALGFFGEHLADRRTVGRDEVHRMVEEFFALYPNRPVAANTGGCGFSNCFWLYLTCRLLEPALVVESGVWKGQTTWLLSQACREATIHSFDLSLKRLVYRSESVQTHEMDWSGFDFGAVDPARSLCFFDCHVNQARRVREAYDRGFRLLLFDDDFPVYRLFSCGAPGLPTVDMLLDETVKPGDRIAWKWQDKDRSYVYQEADEFSARELIDRHVHFPDIGGLSGYGGASFLSFVKLVK